MGELTTSIQPVSSKSGTCESSIGVTRMRELDVTVWANQNDVCICGTGARTSVGFTAPTTAAAVRGAISGIAAHAFFVDRHGEPMSVASDPGLAPDLGLADRMEVLLTSALTEALEGSAMSWPTIGARCWLALPAARPGLTKSLSSRLVSTVVRILGLAATDVQIIQRGHAAGIMGLQLAAGAITAGKIDIGLVLGVDSYHDPDTLEWLDQRGLLMSPSNRNGFPPGEAAGACLLVSESVAGRSQLPVLCRLIATSTALEPRPIGSPDPCIGEGLSAVLKQVIGHLALPVQKLTGTYCDLNGERYRSEEFTYALLRTQTAFVNPHDYQCPADCWGDVGAASGLLFATLAIVAHQRGYLNGCYPLIWAGSEDGFRAAAVLSFERV